MIEKPLEPLSGLVADGCKTDRALVLFRRRFAVFPFHPCFAPLVADAFERLAQACELRLASQPLRIAPRDILAPLEAIEQHFLVELTRPRTGTAPVRLIFVRPLTELSEPTLRDVLWWLASDAWVLEQHERKQASWAGGYGYLPDEEATARLFAQHVRQTDALVGLLGEVSYRRLLALVAQEMDLLEERG